MLSPDAKAIWKSKAGASLMAAMLGTKTADESDRKTARELARMSADDTMAADEAFITEPRAPGLAFDRASVRTFDVDGRLHVELTNISKAAVNPYLGSEIPDFEALGLDPSKVYRLLRDPAELEAAAATFNNIPLLSKHVPVTAAEPQKQFVVGSTGTDAVFEAPYLKNSLVVWDAEAIKGVESEEQRELSCAYRYTPVMEPGTYEGVRFDGRMTQLIGNHVALVRAGRAGPDVIVGDSQLTKDEPMKSKPLSRHALVAMGALIGSVAPLLAADAKPDFKSMLTGVDAGNWKDKKAGIAHAIKPMLAKDADLGEVVQLLDKLNPGAPEAPAKEDVADAIDADPVEDVLALLRGKVSDEDLAAVAAKLQAITGAPAADATPAEPKDPDAGPPVVPPNPKEAPAMDAATISKQIAAAVESGRQSVLKQTREAAEAREVVRPYVGTVSIALDSAEAVYGAALGLLGVKADGIHPSALRAVLEAQPKPGDQRPARVALAQDTGTTAALAERFPGLNG